MTYEITGVETYSQNKAYESTHADADESVWSKISRESQLISKGVEQGLTDCVNDTIKSPGHALARAGAAAVAAAPVVLGLACARLSLTAAAEATTVATTLYLMSEGKERLNAFGETLQDYWNNPQNKDIDEKKVANSIAPLIVDGVAASVGYRFGISRTAPYINVLAKSMRPMEMRLPEALLKST